MYVYTTGLTERDFLPFGTGKFRNKMLEKIQQSLNDENYDRASYLFAEAQNGYTVLLLSRALPLLAATAYVFQ